MAFSEFTGWLFPYARIYLFCGNYSIVAAQGSYAIGLGE